jgi:hypothetical protein
LHVRRVNPSVREQCHLPLQSSGSALFAGSFAEFADLAPASRLTAHLVAEFNRRWGTVTPSEENSWRRSLTALAGVASSAELAEAGVGVELRLPLTDRRIDVSFVGRDRTDRPHVFLVELKQWDRAEPSEFPDNVVVGGSEMLHPSIQASSYAEYLRGSHSAFTEENFALSPCAYLHDMPQDMARRISDGAYAAAVATAPLFARDDEEAIRRLLLETVGGGPGMDLLPSLIQGRFSPSKQLIESVAKALAESPVWTLLDEQRVAFNIVRGLVERAVHTGDKAVVLVVGGPGTGKSVIAVHLLVELSQATGYRACHATGSKAFTTNLRAIGPVGAAALFKYFNGFKHKMTDPNAVDILVCDEAHRIRQTSNDRFTKKALKSEISQARELIRAARVSVFFLDERQNVRPGEIGTTEAIAHAAREESVPLHRVNLNAQFRCNGCARYIDWVDDLFTGDPHGIEGWLRDGEYDFRVVGSPGALETAITVQAARGATGRLVAGFCWPWSDPGEEGALVDDVQIGSWRRPWNEKSPEQTRSKGASPPPLRHPYYLWATKPERIREVGCIYSAQGFEWDYCGVIMGDDLVWRSGRGWVGSKGASEDPAIQRGSLEPDELRALLAHTYRVLFTRGMKGTFVYSTDGETRRYLAAFLTQTGHGSAP